ncbi:SGNH/GDSL hydrolase family protein [Pedobacter nyackensis]|uniref:SGNH/GDSL hydrolase family protein n=1 Tax=Pedobacter nyackensis TaxID=475255 RepID=UPI00292FA19B|nr:SGNH/GDSL hydrolase family protein [Pedobacter nyackensis]
MTAFKLLICTILAPLFLAVACDKVKSEEPGKEKLPQKIKNVVILGNSIVAHPVKTSIGWNADWGMAASVRDSDFVHRLIHKIHKVDPAVDICYTSIAPFELNYETYDLSQLSTYRNADIIIIKISENVDLQTAEKRGFITYYDKLIKYLNSNQKSQIIISDGFWPSPVNELIKTYAIDHKYPFVTLPDLYRDDVANSARGKFENEGVGNHPSDQGMRNIANRIWDCIARYFQ